MDHVKTLADLDARINASATRNGITFDKWGDSNFHNAAMRREMDESRRKWHRECWCRAIWHLWTAKYHPRGNDSGMDEALSQCEWWKRIYFRFACSLAMVLHRRGWQDRKKYDFNDRKRWSNNIPMVFWDHRSDGWGWDVTILEFHPWQLRYRITTDGE
jgi:hypothetical protein